MKPPRTALLVTLLKRNEHCALKELLLYSKRTYKTTKREECVGGRSLLVYPCKKKKKERGSAQSHRAAEILTALTGAYPCERASLVGSDVMNEWSSRLNACSRASLRSAGFLDSQYTDVKILRQTLYNNPELYKTSQVSYFSSSGFKTQTVLNAITIPKEREIPN